jgi:outer membrane protein TolC
VLTAIGEVELSLVRHRQELERSRVLDEQLDVATSSVRLQADRFAAGVAGYPDYLDALRNELSVRTNRSQAHRDLALARLAVHRALGGRWVPDPTSSPVAATDNDPGRGS